MTKRSKSSKYISMHQWREIYTAYTTGASVARCARIAGVGISTALKYIREGEPTRGLESIERLVRRHSLVEVQKREDALERSRQALTRSAFQVLMQHQKVLEKAELVSGVPLANGKVTIDTKEMLRHSLGLGRVQTILNKALNPPSKKQDVQQNVFVNTSASAVATSHVVQHTELLEQRFQALEKSLLTSNERKLPAKERARILAAKVAKTRRKDGRARSEEIAQ